jgi:RNA polymerase sigma-70 factor (family 1)
MTNMPFSDEKELLLQLKDGSPAAFEQLYLRYSRRILGNICKFIHDGETAKEVLQDVFMKVWEKRALINTEQSFRSYLFTISRNLVYDYFRHQKLETKLQHYLSAGLSEAYTHIEEELLYKESNERYIRAVEKLPPQRRTVYTLCKIEGKSYEEVSGMLGITPATISDHLLKANRYIRSELLLPALVLCLTV